MENVWPSPVQACPVGETTSAPPPMELVTPHQQQLTPPSMSVSTVSMTPMMQTPLTMSMFSCSLHHQSRLSDQSCQSECQCENVMSCVSISSGTGVMVSRSRHCQPWPETRGYQWGCWRTRDQTRAFHIRCGRHRLWQLFLSCIKQCWFWQVAMKNIITATLFHNFKSLHWDSWQTLNPCILRDSRWKLSCLESSKFRSSRSLSCSHQTGDTIQSVKNISETEINKNILISCDLLSGCRNMFFF